MFALSKLVHVLAVGLWFGMSVFFTFVVGLSLFDTFEKLTADPKRDYWLPTVPQLEKEQRPSTRFPDPLRKEQGSRIAGAAVGPMFLPYYALQMGCGVLAILTSVLWFGRGGVHKMRLFVLGMALASAGVGWWLEGKVEELRVERSNKSDAVLVQTDPSPALIQAADAARAEFGLWHTYSLFVNFATIACVTVTMGMAAFLPNRTS
jgi:hypothetical protein